MSAPTSQTTDLPIQANGGGEEEGQRVVRSEKLSAKFWRAIPGSTDLVRRFDVITVEDLKIRGMIWNRRFAQAICVWLGGLFHDDEGQS
jgi:hypothetical protein